MVETARWSHAGIWVDPDRMGGDICLEGTRIPASLIADMLLDEGGEAEARLDYGLSGAAIQAAKDWNSAGRPDRPWGGVVR